VRLLTSRSAAAISWLLELGVAFDRDAAGNLSTGLEGGHSHRRIVHAGGDATGRKVMERLSARLSEVGNLAVYPNVAVTSLVQDVHGRVVGALGAQMVEGLPNRASPSRSLWLARKGVVLATGGIGGLYPYTSNPEGATGDGLALAYCAGAELRNLEFVQFHPTILNVPASKPLLISEAVRGAGARLVDSNYKPIMQQPAGDLQTRDIVARAIFRHQRLHGPVFLDMTGIPNVREKFPTIASGLADIGFDPITSPIPVTPAAHFLMGGVHTDLRGRTSVPGLYAVGEVAHTGVHGANRLASNSLLECIVMAFEAVADLAAAPSVSRLELPDDICDVLSPERDCDVLARVQDLLWRHVGIEREGSGLQAALGALDQLRDTYPQSGEVLVARWMAKCALEREESRGAHFRVDFPQESAAWLRDTRVSSRKLAYTSA
jgi:L-aspartate oxidase